MTDKKENDDIYQQALREYEEEKKSNTSNSDQDFLKQKNKRSRKSGGFLIIALAVIVVIFFLWDEDDEKEDKQEKNKRGLVNTLGSAPKVKTTSFVEKPDMPLPTNTEPKESTGLKVEDLPPLPTKVKESEWLKRKMSRSKSSEYSSVNPQSQSSNNQQRSNDQNTKTESINASDYDSLYSSNDSVLSERLKPTVTDSVKAQVLPNRDYLITKGTSIDCTLVNAIDTSVDGFVTCRTSNDIYSDSGRVLLVEKGSKVVGEYRTLDRSMGDPRLFILWTRLTTPLGVAVDLNSAGTDSLGRAGVGGDVDNFWFKRFGSAFMTSIMKDSLQIVINDHNRNSSNVVLDSTQNTTDSLIDAMIDQHRGIMPRIVKNQGEIVRIYISRDINFKDVYRLQRVNQ